MSFMSEAHDNWPEDEASLLADYAKFVFESEGRDYYHQWLIKERVCARSNIFDDDEDLFNRFADRFNKLMAEQTGFYM